MADVRFVDQNLKDWLRPRETPARSEGLHVSDVVLRLLKAGSWKFEHYGTPIDPTDQTREAMFRSGFAWEDLIAGVLRRQHALEPGAVVRLPSVEIARAAGDQLLYGTPDTILYGRGFLYDDAPSPWRIEETKATWMSARLLAGDDPAKILREPKFAYWVLQLKTYAAILADWKTRFGLSYHYIDGPAPKPEDERVAGPVAPTCVLRAIFMNGDYTRYAPTAMCWRIDWTVDELETHWQMITEFLTDEAEMRPHDDRHPDAPTV